MTNVLPDSSNPYFAKAMIHDPEMFFGRADLLKRVYETVAHRQCVSIVGPRGIGKSSFLWYASRPEVQVQFPFDLRRHLFVLLDLRNYLNKTCEDFFHKVSKAIIASGKKRGLILQSNGKGEDEFSSILDQVEEQDFFPVLLLDAFDKVTRNEHFDPEFFEFLRAHASLGQVSYVTASIAPLSEICHRGIAGSPFFNIFYTYPMEPLLPEEARTLITTPAQQASIPFSNSEITLVLRLAGRHPFFIQHVCHLLFQEKVQQEDSEIDIQHLKKLAYKDLSAVFKDIWEQLSETDQRRFLDEMLRKENQGHILPELSESELFRQFVRKSHQGDQFQLYYEDVEEALDKIGDVNALGHTNLHHMRIISHRLENKAMPSTMEKGLAIREVLSEAFERLRASSTRTDTAPEWLFYNVLYYRHFRYHLKNVAIAQRLGFSSRQYYRLHEKAVEALFNVLCDMEYQMEHDLSTQILQG